MVPAGSDVTARATTYCTCYIRRAQLGIGLLGIALMSCCSFPYCVDTAGHPTPGPCRFWRVESKVAMRACCSGFESPVGNGAAMGGLLIMWPAATFAFRAYDEEECMVRKMVAIRWRGGGLQR